MSDTYTWQMCLKQGGHRYTEYRYLPRLHGACRQLHRFTVTATRTALVALTANY